MRIDIATLFPAMIADAMSHSIIGRAVQRGLLELHTHNIRDFTLDKWRRVDDTPYGGGMGMLMQAEPIYRCYRSVADTLAQPPLTIYLSPRGRVLNQAMAMELARLDRDIFLICGHYEGIDQRLIDEIVDLELSIGDYVLTGGELAAMVVTDCVVRLREGVLSSSECFMEESHAKGLLEYPQYTRPPEWNSRAVPEVLLSGNHKRIADFRLQQAIEITRKNRPDMYKKYLEEISADKE